MTRKRSFLEIMLDSVKERYQPIQDLPDLKIEIMMCEHQIKAC